MSRKRPPANKWVVALSVSFGTLMGAIDTSIVNVALSQIRGAVGATVQEITWISTGFAIAMVMVMPLTAFLSRLFGQKNVYLACLALFLLGSALCGIAWNLPSLVLFRALQGFGAGALQPTEQAILRQTFPPKEQGTAMALFAMAVMVGPALGPTLGGYIVDNLHWSWIFFINLPVGALGMFMVWRFVEEPEDIKAAMRAEAIKQRKNMDWAGIALLWTALISLQYVLEEGQAADWFESQTIVLFTGLTFFASIAFVVRELSAPAPAVNLRLFADPGFASGVVVNAAVFAVLMAGMFLLPVFMQELLGFTAMQSGFALMPRTLVMLVLMPLIGKLYARVHTGLLAGVGLLLAAIGQFMLSGLTLASGSGQVIGAIIIQGVGMAVMLVPINTVALANVPRHKLPDATGLSSLMRQIGGSIGIAAFATTLGRYGVIAKDGLRPLINGTRPEVVQRLARTEGGLMARGLDAAHAHAMALRGLSGLITREGMVLAFEKLFVLGGLMFLVTLPLLAMLKKPKIAAAQGPTHVELEG
ncbi:MAG: DHA2 family efflux MFS transporter permease subunit [Myxococcota bacterium]